ncbi:MAG: tRNA (guanosine(46)-N7)-methyltransferase TrmB [Bacteroidetes bacterium]|nr:tRNA (guanosine(46)-N7)-methyltransferase TrmB [Bacteroidota bacterium]MDA1120266.1 tRNA (guanosine(46)-N7)-methyltransferase TrmB [Bacteroidota bacterium]
MRRKLERFEENYRRDNVVEQGKELFNKIKGCWKEKFKNENPIVIELGCGYGEYTIGLARQFPEKNFIGIDRKGARIWKGSKTAEEEGLMNVAFLRTHVLELENFFDECEISEIWITFPDPRSRSRDERRRLTNPRFLNIYRHLIQPQGIVHLKTDSTELFEYSLNVLNTQMKVEQLFSTTDLYGTGLHEESFGIQTRFEQMFLQNGETIKYLRFNFK